MIGKAQMARLILDEIREQANLTNNVQECRNRGSDRKHHQRREAIISNGVTDLTSTNGMVRNEQRGCRN